MADNRIKKNMIIGISCRLLILAMGVLLPRLVMLSFGSEANGLLNTVVQIFTYVALLEAGIGNATLNALYAPVAKEDRQETARIMASARRLYRKTTGIYMFCVVALSVILPFIIESEISKPTIAIVTFLQGVAGAAGYYITAVYKQLLAADGKYYYSENSQLLTHVISTAGKIVLIQLGADIIGLQILNFAVSCIGITYLHFVVRKQYPWLDMKNAPKDFVLKERSAFVVHEMAGTVFSCTDLIVVSSFCGLAASSVYTVYNLVYSSLQTLLSTVVSGTTYLVGQAYHKGEEFFCKMYDVYDRLYICLVFSVMTVACALTESFIKLYTAGVTDAVYVDKYLPFLFALVAILSSCRMTASRAVSVAGHAKRTQGRAIIEAVINLVVSIVCVNLIGIYGVLVGTIVALLYRTTDLIIYANLKILKRSCLKPFINVFAMFAIAIPEVLLMRMLAENVDSYFTFAIYGFLMLATVMLINFTIVGLTNLKNIRWLRQNMSAPQNG